MPITVSYTDLGLIGSLAHKAGVQMGQADRDARFDQTRLAQQQMQMQERSDVRHTVASQMQQESQLDAQQRMQEQRLQMEMAQLGQTAFDRDADRRAAYEREQFRQEQQNERSQMTTDRALEVEQMRGANRLSSRGQGQRTPARPRDAYTPSMGQTKEYARTEAQKHADAIPVDMGRGRTSRVAEKLDEQMSTAENISRMSTQQLREFAQTRKGDPWMNYVNRVLAEREQLEQQGAQGGGPMGGIGPMSQRTGGNVGNPGNVRGFDPSALRGLNDDEILGGPQ